MASQSAGSLYHLSSLRYAQVGHSPGLYVARQAAEAPDQQTTVPLDPFQSRFQQAEDSYRSGQSSSSSLLIRPQAGPSSAAVTCNDVVDGDDDDAGEREGIEGFQRTKARAMLANSVPYRASGPQEPAVNMREVDQGSSIYLRNRRARHPLSRSSWERVQARRRKGRTRAKTEIAPDVDVDDNDHAGDGRGSAGGTSEVERRVQADAEALFPFMPSGSLMETIHYLAALYYDARGMLHAKDAPVLLAGLRSSSLGLSPSDGEASVQSDRQDTRGQADVNMLQVCEGSALVALAVYLEETIKYEMRNQPNEELQRRSDFESQDAQQALAKLHKETRKAAREREKGRGKRKDKSRLVLNAWAQRRRRKHHKPSPQGNGEDDGDAHNDTDGP